MAKLSIEKLYHFMVWFISNDTFIWIYQNSSEQFIFSKINTTKLIIGYGYNHFVVREQFFVFVISFSHWMCWNGTFVNPVHNLRFYSLKCITPIKVRWAWTDNWIDFGNCFDSLFFFKFVCFFFLCSPICETFNEFVMLLRTF